MKHTWLILSLVIIFLSMFYMVTHVEQAKNAMVVSNEQNSFDEILYLDTLHARVPEIDNVVKKTADDTNGEVRIVVSFDEVVEAPYYVVAYVKEQHTDRYITMWTFYIDTTTHQVYFYDSLIDEIVGLDVWRSSL